MLTQIDRPLIEPVYLQSAPNELIDLGTEKVDLSGGGENHSSSAQVSLRFMPRPGLEFRFTSVPPQNWLPLSTGQVHPTLTFHKGGGQTDVFCIHAHLASHDPQEFVFVPTQEPVGTFSNATEMHSAKFHIFNFPDFLVHPIQENYTLAMGTSRNLLGKVVLAAGNWIITIAATAKTKELCDQLKTAGGYAITHVGEVKALNGEGFSGEQLYNLLTLLNYFVSFVLGRESAIALPVGYDIARTVVWRQWGLPVMAPGPWQGGLSWFDSRHGEFLSNAFAGFYKLWQDPLWHDPLRKAVGWYLQANNRNPTIHLDTGLIFSQMALELLAWTYCVRSKKMVSSRAFGRGGLVAADKMRLLCSALGIPVELPTSLAVLSTKLSGDQKDIAELLAHVRNSIVHPKAGPASIEPGFDVWNCSVWLVELVLLKLIGYQGEYGNRLRINRYAGDVDALPWQPSQPAMSGTT